MVTIDRVDKRSLADRLGLRAGDRLVSLNGYEINDVLDYEFYAADSGLRIEYERGGVRRAVSVWHPAGGDLGLHFSTYLMDEKRRCRNGCIFCFIDQNPKGLRESLYFKDDDERLSFLQGNYVTLTNLDARAGRAHCADAHFSHQRFGPHDRPRAARADDAQQRRRTCARLSRHSRFRRHRT